MKSIIDIISAFIGLIILFPVLIIVSVVLLWVNKGKVFFTQKRVGKKNKVFKILKFRTMNNTDILGLPLPDDRRLTKIGRFLRKTSLDELPQLINVLNGDMSLVGPRPLLVEYLPLYNDYQQRRHEVNPGITGWAQINGRNNISWQKKFKYDVWYVDNYSFILDLKIIWQTLKRIWQKKEYLRDNLDKVEKFNGHN